MTKDGDDLKIRTTSGVRSTRDMDHAINDLASKFVSMSMIINELRSAILGDVNHSNREANHHGYRRFCPKNGGSFDNHDCDQSPKQVWRHDDFIKSSNVEENKGYMVLVGGPTGRTNASRVMRNENRHGYEERQGYRLRGGAEAWWQNEQDNRWRQGKRPVYVDKNDTNDQRNFKFGEKGYNISYALVVKGVDDGMMNSIPKVAKQVFEEFNKVLADDPYNFLPPCDAYGTGIRAILSHEGRVADALSMIISFQVNNNNKVVDFESVKVLYASDEDFRDTWEKIETKQHRCDFLVLDGCFFKWNHLCIPKASLRSQMIKKLRSRGLSGHLGRDRTVTSMEKKFYWPQLKRDVGVLYKILLHVKKEGARRKIWSPPNQVVDLIDLPRMKNIQANRMVEDVQSTHEFVRTKIVESNAKYKVVANKHRWVKLFNEGNEMMTFL
uniref:Transposon Ty3-I Gag-Pol polyprotein n=1 Tax=Tanacetum cinerariifolium TaxID=118510 RepID=A0A699I243_TANCI|nr:transposon Ty3-I Gag-Pol polyprotein [Tanacetum cinerariifolium]